MPRPNLLFIFTDEQRADTLAAYGNRRIQMPNLNRLAEQSVVFDQAYVTQPVCTPSRSSIMTGLYPHTSGLTENNLALPDEVPCLVELLDQPAEYVKGYYGKWHLGDEIFKQHGFDDWVGVEDNYIEYYSPKRDRDARCEYHHWLVANGFAPKNGSVFGRGEAARLPEAFGKPAFLGQEASRFIRENKDNPFILYVNFLEPHMPFFGPRDNQYSPDAVKLPGNFSDPPTADQPLKAQIYQKAYYERGHSGLPLKTEADWRRMIAHYWGLCSLVDTHVGRILDTLSECGLDDHTIVVYTSDHGDMMGSHRLIAKTVMFEEAVRVPFLVRLPGQRRSWRVRGPVSQVDIAPTLLDLLGQPVPSGLEGQSLRSAVEAGRDSALQDDVFIEWSGHNNGFGDVIGQVVLPEGAEGLATPEQIAAAILDPVRTVITPDGWKLNYSPTLGEHELYNLAADPLEVNNLARRAEHRPRMRELAGRIVGWQQRTGDQVEVKPESIQ